MNFTIPETRVTRAVYVHAGTRWADGVWVPHLVVMFVERGLVAAILAITLFKKIDQRFRKSSHVMLITNLWGGR